MTEQEFTTFYPQFGNFSPAVVLSTYLEQANARFGSFAAADRDEARRLYTAHKLTLYARSALPEGATPTPAMIAASGEMRQVASKKVDDVEVRFSNGTSSGSAAATGFGDLAETSFGLQLLSLLRMYHMTKYIR